MPQSYPEVRVLGQGQIPHKTQSLVEKVLEVGVNRPRGLGMWGTEGNGTLRVAVAQNPDASRRISRRWRSNRRAVPQQCADILNFSALIAGPHPPILHGKTPDHSDLQL